MELLKKLYNEHRQAYDIIIQIEKSNDSPIGTNTKILNLFNSELLPHFRQEENELFTDDFGSRVLMKEHNQVYDLIKRIESDKSGDYKQFFCDIMKGHIKTEEDYFRQITQKDNIKPAIIIALIALVAGFLISRTIGN